ncbi:MAG: hypothetical protein MI743_20340 [Sneathiellales bacterium]|nr:hypothetical protein [Sneathiellales bacterium]
MNKVLCFMAAVLPSLSSHAAPNAIDDAVYFRSQIKDSPQCTLNVDNGKIAFPASVTNPAASCPDAFAWKKFVEAIQSEFWQNWSYDAYSWPQEPYALCSDKDDPASCCAPTSNDNPGYQNADNPGLHCPYYPGDHIGSGSKTLTVGKPPLKQHFSQIQTAHPSIMDKLDPGRVIRQEMAEVVYRNKPMWSYIFNNDLYNTNGLADKFNQIETAIADHAP